MKTILFDEKARAAIKRGIDTAVDLVKLTIGPRGRNVDIENPFGAPTTTNDGVSIVKQVVLEDPFENMGAAIVKEVANKTNEEAGDGTTSTSVLLQSIIDEGMKKMESGLNVIGIKNGMSLAVKDIVAKLKDMSLAIDDPSIIKQIATISAESEELGGIIAETIEEIGVDGVVTVEQSPVEGVTSEVVSGMQVESGYISPYFVTDQERMEAVLESVPVLIFDGKLQSMKKFLPFLEKMMQSGRNSFVLIAEEVIGEVLSTLVMNKLKGAINVVAIKSPSYGDHQKALLEDIAVFTGGVVVSESKGHKLEEMDLDVLGVAKRVIVKKDKTTLVEGQGTGTDEYVKAMKQVDAKTELDKERISNRIANLTGGIAVIRVGAATEKEMGYIKDKVEDAVNATQAAIEEGIVAGGGSALIHASQVTRDLNDEELIGYNIVKKACEGPLRQIGINAGQGDGSIVVAKVKDGGTNSGYDAKDNVYVEDMIKEGIIDPVKVTRNALQNAASAASTFLTTQGAIATKKQDVKQ
jgi:chaperonin GroEL